MYSHLSEADLNKEIERVFERADLDGDGMIDYSEWQISCVNKESILKRDRLVEAFKHFDKVIPVSIMFRPARARSRQRKSRPCYRRARRSSATRTYGSKY